MKRKRLHRRAFSLVEVMVVMTGLSIGLSIGAVALIATMRSNQVAAGTLLKVQSRTELAEAFRSDVAAAVALPERAGPVSRSATCLILEQAGGDRIVYEWRDGEVIRTMRRQDGETKTPLKLGDPDAAIEFRFPEAGSRLVTLVIVDSPPRGTVRRSEITAVLGGDRR